MHLSLNILQIYFHISGIVFLISLIKCCETAFSYLSILILTPEVLGGNGPSCLGAVKPWHSSCYKMLPFLSHHHPCADTCTYPFLQDSWQVKCSKEVAHGRNWQGTMLGAAEAMWRTAVTWPQQLGSGLQWSCGKKQRWEGHGASTAGEIHWSCLPALLCLVEIRWEKGCSQQEFSEWKELALEKYILPGNSSAWSWLITAWWCGTQE